MNEIASNSIYFGFTLSLLAYYMGIIISRKIKITLCNPLLLSMIIIILVLKILHIDYETYDNGAKYITFLLTPSTICLAVPLYKQYRILKDNMLLILVSIFAGVMANCITILALTVLFRVDHVLYASLLPKSITTAIAMGVSEELQGIPAVTVMSVILTGIFGSVISSLLFKLLRIKEPLAQGLACGTAAHAIGTAKALEIGEIQGAMSSLAIIVTGIITVIAAPIFINFL